MNVVFHTKKINWVIITLFIGLASCNKMNSSVSSKTSSSKNNKVFVSKHLMNAVLWQQTSAEYRALCLQAYNLAQLRIDAALDTIKDKTNLAIITDIDETVLDNSPYEAYCILQHKNFDAKDWDKWVNLKIAKPVPGAKKFLNYVKSKGISIFYVSNRSASQEMATIDNLINEGLPSADTTHLLLKKETSSKESRFNKVRENYTVLMYLGDNASDFTAQYRATSVQKRFALTDSLTAYFGLNFIVLPNPMYGDWESKGVFRGEHNLSLQEKDSIRRENLIGM